jgi:hypothetical protein
MGTFKGDLVHSRRQPTRQSRAESFAIKAARDNVVIDFRGWVVLKLVGNEADELRRVVEGIDQAAIQLLAAHKQWL